MKTYYDEVNFKTIKDLKNEIRLFVKHRALLENNSMLWRNLTREDITWGFDRHGAYEAEYRAYDNSANYTYNLFIDSDSPEVAELLLKIEDACQDEWNDANRWEKVQTL